ncbi:MAG: mucoidy inhibitor MuiA family protein [Shimia sp.]|uniref:mucoidy inhibitor MuiA family protein n=1 Tax=Shimia sp. TaxID=1954381 RepID=UPI004059C96A
MTKSIYAIACAALATPLMADTIPLSAPVTAVTLYSDSATLTRTAPLTAPIGDHEVLITNLPDDIDPTTVRVAVEGAALGAVTVRYAKVPPAPQADGTALAEAKAEVERIETDIRSTKDRQTDILMQADAANARLGYLSRLQSPQDNTSPEALTQTLAIIGQETLKARQEATTAERAARQFEETLKDLAESLVDARATVEALTPPEGEKSMLVAQISADQPVDGALTLVHRSDWNAGWKPVYDLHLTTGDAPSLRIHRNVFVFQDTGEDWSDVDVTLSTSRPNAQAAPSNLSPWRRRIEEPQPMVPKHQGRLALRDELQTAVAEPAMEIAAQPTFDDGINATHVYPTPVSISSGTEALRLALDTVDLSPDVYAFANPMRDDTAFVMAEITNTIGELILNGNADFYLNGTFVTQSALPLVAAGDTVDLSFGAIPGLRLTDSVTNRITGDKGVLTSRNVQSETRVLSAENLTDQIWDLRLIGRVPYSEQEDLVISHQATPVPTDPTYEDQRGILMWTHEIGADQRFEVELSHSIQWPLDLILR